MVEPLLSVRGLRKSFSPRGRFAIRVPGDSPSPVRAVDGVDFDIYPRKTYGLVGETGCGKTTIGKIIAGLIAPTEGSLVFNSKSPRQSSRRASKPLPGEVGLVFQNPYASLNPRKRIGSILRLPMKIRKIPNQEQEIIAVTRAVGFPEPERILDRFPHELSGGERQRVSIARALATKSNLLIADEPVASLDMSIRASVLNLLQDIKEEYELTIILISHDLAVVRYMCDWAMVMYLGKIVESATAPALFENPLHPYTQALIAAIPKSRPDEPKRKISLRGELPSASNPPPGCSFHTRCPMAVSSCSESVPELAEKRVEHFVACHLIEAARGGG